MAAAARESIRNTFSPLPGGWRNDANSMFRTRPYYNIVRARKPAMFPKCFERVDDECRVTTDSIIFYIYLSADI